MGFNSFMSYWVIVIHPPHSHKIGCHITGYYACIYCDGNQTSATLSSRCFQPTDSTIACSLFWWVVVKQTASILEAEVNGRICSAKVSQQIAWLNNRYVGSSGQEAPSCISLPSLQSPKTRFPTPDTPDLEPLIHDPQSNIKTSSSGPRPNASRSKSLAPKQDVLGFVPCVKRKPSS